MSAGPILDSLDAAAARVVRAHLDAPATPVEQLRRETGADLAAVRDAYTFVRADPQTAAFVRSPFYQHRLLAGVAADTVRQWTAQPDRLRRLLAGEPVLSSTVEIHPSIGTCGYRCAMCLWSDAKELTYTEKQLTAGGLLDTGTWLHVLDRLQALGAETVVVSGGGEALLNRDLAELLAHARQLGLRRHVYTTGFNLDKASDELWAELALCDQVRLSIHGSTEALYAQIVGLNAKVRPLARVTGYARRLMALRDALGGVGRVGAGFVVQPPNCHDLEMITAYAVDAGLDFLAIRKDEVDVTDTLGTEQAEAVARQVRRIRAAVVRGEHGTTAVDFSDELIAAANGCEVLRTRTAECHAKLFRPTISPYGILAPCDLKAEPRFAESRYNLGIVAVGTVNKTIAGLPTQFVPDACAQCMPSSRSGNAVYAKLLTDLKAGFPLADQPF